MTFAMPFARHCLTELCSIGFLTALCALALTATSHAALVTDRAEFAQYSDPKRHTGAVTTIVFDDILGTPDFPLNFFETHRAGPRLFVGGLSFSGATPGFTDDAYIAGNAGTTGYYDVDGSSASLICGRRTCTIDLPDDVNIFGADYRLDRLRDASLPPAAETLSVLYRDGTRESFTIDGDRTRRFFGIADLDREIQQIVFTNTAAPAGGFVPYPVFDNVVLGRVAPVPEPASIALMAAGGALLSLATARRRARR
jgi:hypothetical protein